MRFHFKFIVILLLWLFGFSLLLLLHCFSESKELKNPSNSVRFTWKNTFPQNRYGSTRDPLILLFNNWGKDPYWDFKWVEEKRTSALRLGDCPHKCRFTIERERFIDTADMVVVNTFRYGIPPSAPLSRHRILENQRNMGQIWAGISAESPYYQNRRGLEIDDLFHWIGTYRREADIFWPNWSYTKRKVPLKAAPTASNKSKKKLVAWLVSHCSTQSQRELLVQTLQRYVPVDIYGKCGKPCPEGLDCRAYLAANYKFYLAFESSLCVDYVTEKLFAMLNQSEPIVPVTYSWMNDTTLAPPNSHIDARNFKSIKALAEYLQYLDRNDDEYNSYLEWKRDFQVIRMPQDAKLCQACQMLVSYKERLEGGGGRQRMNRRPSMLNWLNSLGSGANFSYFKVAGDLVQTKTVCFHTLKNEKSRNWLRGTN